MTLPAEKQSSVLERGEGRYVVIGGKARCTFKIVGAQTAGQVGLFEYAMEPGAFGAKPHVHHQLTEIFYVAEGEVEIQVGRRRVLGRAGTVALVQPDEVHGFRNSADGNSKLLIIFCPADHREEYFEGLAELTRDGRQATRDELLDLMRRFDQEPIEER